MFHVKHSCTLHRSLLSRWMQGADRGDGRYRWLQCGALIGRDGQLPRRRLRYPAETPARYDDGPGFDSRITPTVRPRAALDTGVMDPRADWFSTEPCTRGTQVGDGQLRRLGLEGEMRESTQLYLGMRLRRDAR